MAVGETEQALEREYGRGTIRVVPALRPV